MHKRVILLATASVLLAGCVSPKQSTSWEYKTISGQQILNLDKELNRLVAEGWMLEKATFAYTPNNNWAWHYLLKRKQN